MRRCVFAAWVISGCATAQTFGPPVAYDIVARVCTEQKARIVDNADSPPSPPEQAAYEATKRVCMDILDAIEQKASEDET